MTMADDPAAPVPESSRENATHGSHLRSETQQAQCEWCGRARAGGCPFSADGQGSEDRCREAFEEFELQTSSFWPAY